MNVVIYARYSSHSQTEQSIEGQIAVCKEFAQKNNYTIIGEYIDRALTGTNDNRPEFQKMIQDSDKKIFEGVLVYQLDRFARNRYDSAIYKNKLKKNGVRVFSAKENISDDASGIVLESLLEGLAEYYSVELAQKVSRGLKINAEKCKHNGGTITLGYKTDKNNNYIIDEDNAKIVKNIFNMYINGYCMSEIIKYLNKNNFKTSYGNDFNKNSIKRILTNKKYIGIYKYGDIEIENGIPQIIDNITFEKVSDMLNKNKKAPARAKAKIEYLLTTKLFCGTCKELMVGVSGTSKTQKIHYYYSCNGKRKHICTRKNIQKDYIENIVVQYAKEILTDKNINKISEEIIKIVEKENNKNNLKTLQRKLNNLKKEKTNLIDALKICDNDNIRKTIFNEIMQIEENYKIIENEILFEKTSLIDIDINSIKFFLTELKNGNINDIKYKKLLINTFIDKVYLYDDHIIIIFNIQDKNNSTKKVPLIEDIESSYMGTHSSPNKQTM